jgi:hypothetical protein
LRVGTHSASPLRCRVTVARASAATFHAATVWPVPYIQRHRAAARLLRPLIRGGPAALQLRPELSANTHSLPPSDIQLGAQWRSTHYPNTGKPSVCEATTHVGNWHATRGCTTGYAHAAASHALLGFRDRNSLPCHLAVTWATETRGSKCTSPAQNMIAAAARGTSMVAAESLGQQPAVPCPWAASVHPSCLSAAAAG